MLSRSEIENNARLFDMNLVPVVNIAAAEIRKAFALDIEQKITSRMYQRVDGGGGMYSGNTEKNVARGVRAFEFASVACWSVSRERERRRKRGRKGHYERDRHYFRIKYSVLRITSAGRTPVLARFHSPGRSLSVNVNVNINIYTYTRTSLTWHACAPFVSTM